MVQGKVRQGLDGFGDGRCHVPRNAVSLQNPEKARKESLP